MEGDGETHLPPGLQVCADWVMQQLLQSDDDEEAAGGDGRQEEEKDGVVGGREGDALEANANETKSTRQVFARPSRKTSRSPPSTPSSAAPTMPPSPPPPPPPSPASVRVDLRRGVGLRNVVVHFRVPRNRVSRGRCRSAISYKRQRRMQKEEEERKWAREKLASVGQLDNFNDYEMKNGRKKWTKRDEPRKTPTDNSAFPQVVSRRRAGSNLGRNATYDSLGEGRNFFILAADSEETWGARYVFTIFPASGSVVATGLRSFPRARRSPPDVLKTFARLTDIPPWEIQDMRVTNSTWSGSLRPPGGEGEKLGPVMRVISDYSRWNKARRGGTCEEARISVGFRSQFFPGVRLQHGDLSGTINLFNNGSYVIVGVKTAREAAAQLRWLAAIMNGFWKKPGEGTSFAWTAD